MKLEYRILEVAEGYEQDCDYCLLDFRDFRFKNSPNLNIATHQIAAIKESGEYADTAYICGSCKKDLENNALPYCELCGRLQRNRKSCFCDLLKDKPVRSLSAEEILSRTFNSRLEKKTRELEKELSVAKVEINTHLEALQVSEGWSKAKVDRIKELEVEVARFNEENKRLKEKNAQIEVKETKKWPWRLKK